MTNGQITIVIAEGLGDLGLGLGASDRAAPQREPGQTPAVFQRSVTKVPIILMYPAHIHPHTGGGGIMSQRTMPKSRS